MGPLKLIWHQQSILFDSGKTAQQRSVNHFKRRDGRKDGHASGYPLNFLTKVSKKRRKSSELDKDISRRRRRASNSIENHSSDILSPARFTASYSSILFLFLLFFFSCRKSPHPPRLLRVTQLSKPQCLFGGERKLTHHWRPNR